MSCEHCEKALLGLHTGYRVGGEAACFECVARAVARSSVTFEAVRSKDIAALRETLARVLPMLPFERSSAMVKAWWLHDQRQRKSLQSAS